MEPIGLRDDVERQLAPGLLVKVARRSPGRWAMPRIVVTGVRSSCDRIPRNVSRASWAARSAVVSRTITRLEPSAPGSSSVRTANRRTSSQRSGSSSLISAGEAAPVPESEISPSAPAPRAPLSSASEPNEAPTSRFIPSLTRTTSPSGPNTATPSSIESMTAWSSAARARWIAGQAEQPGRQIDPLADVAGRDEHSPARCAEVDMAGEHLDWPPVAGFGQDDHRPPRRGLVRPGRVTVRRSGIDRVRVPPDESIGLPAERLAGCVGELDPPGVGVHDDDEIG